MGAEQGFDEATHDGREECEVGGPQKPSQIALDKNETEHDMFTLLINCLRGLLLGGDPKESGKFMEALDNPDQNVGVCQHCSESVLQRKEAGVYPNALTIANYCKSGCKPLHSAVLAIGYASSSCLSPMKTKNIFPVVIDSL